jgi:hypothetical protein
MKRVRLVSLAAAAVVTAMQWAAFFNSVLHAGTLRQVAHVANEMSDSELPVMAAATTRQSIFKY